MILKIEMVTFEINRNIILTRKDLVNENNEKTFDDLTQFGIRDRFFIETLKF